MNGFEEKRYTEMLFLFPNLTTTTTTPNRSIDDWTTKKIIIQFRLFEHACSFPNQDFEVLKIKYIYLVHYYYNYDYQSYDVNMLRIPNNKSITLFHHCVVCVPSYFCFLEQNNKTTIKTVHSRKLVVRPTKRSFSVQPFT